MILVFFQPSEGILRSDCISLIERYLVVSIGEGPVEILVEELRVEEVETRAVNKVSQAKQVNSRNIASKCGVRSVVSASPVDNNNSRTTHY